MLPDLPDHCKKLKGRYPFRLGCPSFIYPDDIIPNVKRLGPFMDEIELLILESVPSERLPSKDQIDTLKLLKQEFGITYNVHLPTDISLSGFSQYPMDLSVEIMKEVFSRLEPLSPETFTLHLPAGTEKNPLVKPPEWEENCMRSLSALVASGIDPARISIETLFYPFEWLEPVVFEMGTSVCMDVGHLILSGQEMEEMIQRFGSRITMVHLHGVDRTGDKKKDHSPVHHFTEEEKRIIREFLKTFKGGLSLEVFSYQKLVSSLEAFHWLDIQFK